VLARRTLIALILIAVARSLGAHADTPSDSDCRKSFAPGQEWSLQAGNGATLVVGKVENWRDETAIHVSIFNIAIPAGSKGAGTTTQIDHLPFSCTALKGSVAKLIKTNASPATGFADGYAQWQAAKGGVFTISVPEVIELMFKMLSGN
jgi:hypothetical protein